KQLDQQTLTVSMRIADNDLGGSRCLGAANGCNGFIRHKAAESLVLKTAGQQLVGGDDAGDTFHID
ncbi:MAG TPA: hypothetical protein VK693_12910, partial [Steroidobacteraceae bacterium]|nr:hypothetical protein [Steroidobacteraceae bacterium]